MDINNLKQQPNFFLGLELIDQSSEQGNQVIHSLPKAQIQNFSIDQEENIELMNIKKGRKFQYKLLKSQKQNNQCLALVFNEKGNILFVACKNSIIIYFNCYTSKMLQKLMNHTDDVNCLYFMKKSNSLVSGSVDGSIIIWKLDKFRKWSIATQLKAHNDDVLCFQMNKSEDLLISGSYDITLKFWKKIQYKWTHQQTLCLKDCSCSISLNEQEEKLISCGDKPFIQVMQINQEKTWSIVQTIKVAEQSYRLSFLNNNQLIFQPKTKDFFEIYYFDQKLRQFKQHKKVQIQICESCDWFFPILFNKHLNLLAVKHGQFLNIFKVQDDANININLIQTIDFKDESLYGHLTDNGKYLATWDFNSKEIQIRHLIYLD